MEPQQPAKAMIVGSCIPPEPKILQITSTTFKLKGFILPPQQLKELKAIAAERDEQRKRVMGDKEWHSLLDRAQHLFWASSIPVRLAHLLRHILAKRCIPAPSETILAKVLAAGQKKSMEAATQQLLDLGMQLPLLHFCHVSEVLVGCVHHAAKVGCVQMGKQKTQPGWDPRWASQRRKNLKWHWHGSVSKTY